MIGQCGHFSFGFMTLSSAEASFIFSYAWKRGEVKSKRAGPGEKDESARRTLGRGKRKASAPSRSTSELPLQHNKILLGSRCGGERLEGTHSDILPRDKLSLGGTFFYKILLELLPLTIVMRTKERKQFSLKKITTFSLLRRRNGQ